MTCIPCFALFEFVKMSMNYFCNLKNHKTEGKERNPPGSQKEWIGWGRRRWGLCAPERPDKQRLGPAEAGEWGQGAQTPASQGPETLLLSRLLPCSPFPSFGDGNMAGSQGHSWCGRKISDIQGDRANILRMREPGFLTFGEKNYEYEEGEG